MSYVHPDTPGWYDRGNGYQQYFDGQMWTPRVAWNDQDPAEPQGEPPPGPATSREDSRWSAALGSGLFGLVTLGILWVETKVFLHNQLSWLIWVPVISVIAGWITARRIALSGCLIIFFLVFFPTFGAGWLAYQQHEGVAHVVRDAREMPGVRKLSASDIQASTWQICDALPTARQHSGGQDPIDIVATAIFSLNGDYSYTPLDHLEMERFVKSVDNNVCSLSSPFTPPWKL